LNFRLSLPATLSRRSASKRRATNIVPHI
jgi:hypothetical protein